MNPIVKEWLNKSEGDFATANRELSVTENPNYDAVCFHSHQCIEKLMKALLIKYKVVPPKTHDLAELERRIVLLEKGWILSSDDLNFLTRAAVDFRYPGESADNEEAEESMKICKQLRDRLLAHIQV